MIIIEDDIEDIKLEGDYIDDIYIVNKDDIEEENIEKEDSINDSEKENNFNNIQKDLEEVYKRICSFLKNIF